MDQKQIIPAEDLIQMGSFITKIRIALIAYNEPVKSAFFGNLQVFIQLCQIYVGVSVYQKYSAFIKKKGAVMVEPLNL